MIVRLAQSTTTTTSIIVALLLFPSVAAGATPPRCPAAFVATMPSFHPPRSTVHRSHDSTSPAEEHLNELQSKWKGLQQKEKEIEQHPDEASTYTKRMRMVDRQRQTGEPTHAIMAEAALITQTKISLQCSLLD